MTMRKNLKRLLAFVLAISMTMSLLTITAFADEKVLVCGYEEHVHTEECYERTLTCGLGDAAPEKQPEKEQEQEPEKEPETMPLPGVALGEGVGEGLGIEDPLPTVPESTEAETTEPEASEPQTTEPQTTEPEATEPDAEDIPDEIAPLSGGFTIGVPGDLDQGMSVGDENEDKDEGETEAPHVHTDACYTKTLICGKVEHVHTEECYKTIRTDLTGTLDQIPQGDGIATIANIPSDGNLGGETYNITSSIHVTTNLTIKNGTIDASALNGDEQSAIIVKDGATLTLENVRIKNGRGTLITNAGMEPRGDNKFRVGGGIYVEKGTLIINKGTVIENNTAQRGGGIFVNKDSSLTMYDGTVQNNQTVDKNSGDKFAGEGGGIFVHGIATISGGKIINNTCNSKTDLGGGGLYVNNGGIATLINATVTNNTAYGWGGGIAGCVHGELSMVAVDGVALYDNTAKGKTHTEVDGKKGANGVAEIIDHHDEASKQEFNAANTMDFYTAGSAIISNYMAGGGSAQYDAKFGSANPVRIKDDEVLGKDKTNTGLVAHPTQASKDKVPAGVKISGNTSTVHGGGIGCNGGLYFGSVENQEIELYNWNLNLKANKSLIGANLSNGAFTFELLYNGNRVTTATNQSGKINFKITNSNFNKAWETMSEVVFTMREVAPAGGFQSGIKYDQSEYKVTVDLIKTLTNTDEVVLKHTTDSNKNFKNITVKYTTYTVTGTVKNVTKVKDADGKALNPGEAVTDNSITFVNSHASNLTVKKVVETGADSAPAPDETFEIKVQLGNGTNDHGSATTYAGDGFYTFHLKANESATIKDVPLGTAYTVTETPGSNPSFTYWAETKSGTVDEAGANITIAKVTNHYWAPKYVDISVRKTWSSNDGTVMPESVTVELWRSWTENGETKTKKLDTQTLDESNHWSFSWTGDESNGYAVRTEENGPKYTYYVVETDISYTGTTNYNVSNLGGGIFKVYDPSVEAEKKDADEGYSLDYLIGAWHGTTTRNETTDEGTALSRTVVLNNEWIPADDVGSVTFTIEKVTEINDETMGGEIEKHLAGAEFTLYNKDGSAKETVTTDENGRASITIAECGTYTLKETKAPTGYDPDDTVWTIVVSNNRFQQSEIEISSNRFRNHWTWKANLGNEEGDVLGVLRVVNTIKRYNLTLNKEVFFDTFKSEIQNGNALLDDKVEFTIKGHFDAINGQSHDFEVPLNKANQWTATLTGLPYGTFTIEEISIPEIPYFNFKSVAMEANIGTWSNGKFTITGAELDSIDVTRAITLTAKNYYSIKRVSMDIDKVVTLDGRAPTDLNRHVLNNNRFTFHVHGFPVDGSEFYDADVTLTVDNNGKVAAQTLTNLPVGKYVVTETSCDDLPDYSFSGVTFAVTGDGIITPNGAGQTINFDLTNAGDNAHISVTATNNYDVKLDYFQIHKEVRLDGDEKDGETAAPDLAGKNFSFRVTGKGLNGEEQEQFISIPADGTQKTLYLPHGTYTVKEETYDLENYTGHQLTFTSSSGTRVSEEGFIKIDLTDKTQAGGTITVSAVNSYTRKTDSLSVTKVITGNAMDYSSRYDFTVAFHNPFSYVKFNTEVNAKGIPYTVVDAEGKDVYVLDENGQPTDKVKGGTLYPMTETVPEIDENGEPVMVEQYVTVVIDGETYTVYGTIENIGHNETAVINDLPVGIKYHVEEVQANQGYSTSYAPQNGVLTENVDDHVTVTNGHSVTAVNVQKIWEGDEANRRPAEITVQLYRNGEPVEGRTKVLNAENGWRASWTGLSYGPTYTVAEVGTYPGYTATVTGEGRGTTVNITITNTYDEDSDSSFLRVVKVWEGNEAGRPDSITVQLLKNGQPEGESVTLSDANAWTYEWTGLDATAAYDVRELDIPEGYVSTKTANARTYTITNTWAPKTSLTVNKSWVNRDGSTTAPEGASVTVTLTRNGESTGTMAVLSAANNWTFTFEGLDAEDANGNAYTYSVTETAYDGYTAEYVRVSDGVVTVTNRWDETTQLSTQVGVNKVWEELDGTEATVALPDSITVNLYRDGEFVSSAVLSAANGWGYVWTGLDVNGTYTVEEVEVEGWMGAIDRVGNSFTLTNVRDDTFDIPEDDTPLTDRPDTPDEDIPDIDIPDDDVPLDDVPKTGDDTLLGLWLTLAALSGTGLLALCVISRKHEDIEETDD